MNKDGKVLYLDIPWSKQKLTVQVRLLNDIHVSDNDFSVGTRCNAHHCPVLEHFTADGTRTNLDLKELADNALQVPSADPCTNHTILNNNSFINVKFKRLHKHSNVV